MEIDIINISKEDLIKIWEQYHQTEDPTTSLNTYCKWLEDTDFGSDVLNDLAYEIVTAINSIYRYGLDYYDYEKDEDIHIEFGKINPDLKQLVEVSIDAIKQDSDLLKEYGIAKKTSKNFPIAFSEIDWKIYNKFI